MSQLQPPKFAIRFLRWFLRPELLEEVEGDLLEQFYLNIQEGISPSRARRRYTIQVLNYMRPFAIKNSNIFKNSNNGMIKNYYKIAWRNIFYNKMFSAINIFGLALGISIFVLVGMYIQDELTFESQHSNRNRIVRVINERTNAEGSVSKIAATSYPVSEQGVENFPAIESAVRLLNIGRARVSPANNEQVSFYEETWFANPEFLTVFDFEVIYGNKLEALSEQNTVVLTESMALKLFNKLDIIGESVVNDRDSLPYTITAVLKDFPSNSHINFNLIYSEKSVKDERMVSFLTSTWDTNYYATYLLLNPDMEREIVSAMLNKFYTENIETAKGEDNRLILQPLNEIHFESAGIEQGLGQSGNFNYVLLLGAAALFVLLIACLNYMNLTTARFTKRSKELGIRKVSGAVRSQIVIQLLTESLLISTISLGIGLIIITLALPEFNDFTNKSLTLDLRMNPELWLGLIGMLFMVGLFSGSYPAIVQSKEQPIKLLRSQKTAGKQSLPIRQVLVIAQFTISIILIASTLTMYLQMRHIRNQDLGFNKDQLVIVDINSGLVRRGAQHIKKSFGDLSAVQSIALSSRVPGEWKQIPKIHMRNGDGFVMKEEEVYFIGLDNDFFSTLQIDLLSGRNFEALGIEDSTSVIINETAARNLGISMAENQEFSIPSADFYGNIREFDEPFNVRVVGIVKDFNFKSLHEEVAPMVMSPTNNPIHRIDYFIARVDPSRLQETLGSMEQVIHSVDEAHIFEYNFLDQKWAEFYLEDERRQMLIMTTAILTIFIACLGLFGLTTFMVEQRLKEIGVRKVLGAKSGSLALLLSKDFLILVGVSLLIATPVSWYFLNSLLQEFAYRINLNIWIFLAAGLIAGVLALITVSQQSLKAAQSNPVDSLRME